MRLALAIVLVACGQDRLVIAKQTHTSIVQDDECGCTPSPDVSGASLRDTVISSYITGNPQSCVTIGDTDQLHVGTATGPGSWGPVVYRSLVAIDAIPSGQVTGWRLRVWQDSALSSGAVRLFRAADANAWEETDPPDDRVAQYGKPDYYHSAHGVTNGWAGWTSSGLGHIGVDHDADPEPPTLVYSPDTAGLHTIELPLSWLIEWRDGARVNNGILFKSSDYYTSREDRVSLRSSEAAEHPLTFEIDVATDPAPETR